METQKQQKTSYSLIEDGYALKTTIMEFFN